MIKYSLICSDCSENFDSWFSSSKEFDKLKKSKFINCPNCNSYNVKKSLMAPSVINKKKDNNNLNSKKHLMRFLVMEIQALTTWFLFLQQEKLQTQA